MNEEILNLLKGFGFEDKVAKAYISCLFIGEASVKDIAKFTKIKRTSIYNFIDNMLTQGLIYEVKHNKKIYYSAVSPKEILKKYKKNLDDFENRLEVIEEEINKTTKRQKVSFLHGPAGFRSVWDRILKSSNKEYRIMTEGINFLDYVTSKYLVDEIIRKKKDLGIKSLQIIPESKYSKEVIVPKDKKENRVTKLLPSDTKLPFTEIICQNFVAYISPRNESSIFLIEDELFAEGRKKVFDLLWERLD